MLVLSLKKSEAILIDGMIRIEVVSLARATVRVRLMAPRSLQVTSGPSRKENRERQDAPARTGPAGMDVSHMTLLNQQVFPLGETVNLGVVDADKSRVLFFVDAPLGTSITTVDPAAPGTPERIIESDSAPVHGPRAQTPEEPRRSRPSTARARTGRLAMERARTPMFCRFLQLRATGIAREVAA